MAKLSERIKELRTEAGFTQTELGKMFGIVKSTVSLYENGKSTPNDDIKLKICKHFNVTMDYLLGNSNVRNYSDTITTHRINDESLEYNDFLAKAELILNNNAVTDNEKEKLMLDLNEIFWRSKKKNK